MRDLSFYKDKTVLVTGHTGFKGSWLCKVLLSQGAKVIGYALQPQAEPSLFRLLELDRQMISIYGDIRDLGHLQEVIQKYQPEIVIHMAAQPLVRESYTNPVYTYETNVMGTVHILEVVRCCQSVRSVINVTTDKVYKNNEWEWGYREIDVLNGFDPYSNSKSCSELVTSAYKNSFFQNLDIAVSTCRAGNVIGGGDFAKDRIIPDCIRAVMEQKDIIVRNPHSTRPYQHVLEPVCVYLDLAAKQYQDHARYEGGYNIGPDDCDCVTTGRLVDLFCSLWGENIKWVNQSEANAPHEANFLKLDCTKMKHKLCWQPKWHIAEAVAKTVTWTKAWVAGENMNLVTDAQIKDFLGI